MNSKSLFRIPRVFLASAALLAYAPLSSAATLQWDANGVAPLGGTGTWDTTAANWFNAGYQAWVNANNDDAVFNTSAGTVTLGTAITANSLTFDITGYTVAGGGNALTLGAGGITVNGTAASLATVTTQIAGTSGLTKAGVGILSIGTAGNYTGNSSITGGIIRLEVANALNTLGTLDIGSGARFDLFRGTGANTAGNERYSQTVAGLTGAGTLRFGQNLTQGNPGVLTINVSGSNSSTFNGVVNTSATGGSRRAAITKDGTGTQIWTPSSVDLSYTDLRVNAGTFRIGGNNAVGGYINLTGNGAGTLDLNGFNMSFDSTASAVITNTNNATLSIINPNFNSRTWASPIQGNIQVRQTQDLTNYSGTNTFTGGVQLDSGGYRIANTNALPVGTINFNGGRLEFGQPNNGLFNADVATDRIYKVQAGTAGEAGAFRSTTASAATPSQIILRGAIDNATSVSNPGNIRFHGFGTSSQTNNATYTLHGGGSYTGQLIIGEGTGSNSSFTLRPGVANGLAQGATLGFVGGATTVQTFNLNGFNQQLAGITNTASTDPVTSYSARVINTGSAATFTVANAVDNTFNGTLGGTAANNFGFTKSGIGTLTLSGANTYTGATIINNGTLDVTGSLADTTAVTVNTSGTYNVGASDTVGAVTLAGGTISNSGGAVLTGSSYAMQSGTVSGILGGTGALTKSTAGTVNLSGINTYTGATTVSAGTLLVNGSLAAGSAVSVASGATLGGSGTISGTTTILIGATLSPGTSPGLSTMGSTTLNTGSDFVFELIGNTTAGRGTNYDGVNILAASTLTIQSGVTSSLVFNAGSTVNWSDTFWATDQQWLVFDTADNNYSGPLFGSLTLTTDSASQSLASIRSAASFNYSVVSGDIFLNYTAIPEPSTYAMLGLGLAALVWLRRKNKNNKA